MLFLVFPSPLPSLCHGHITIPVPTAAPSPPCRLPLLLPDPDREQGATSPGESSPERSGGLPEPSRRAGAGPGTEPGRDAAFLGKRAEEAGAAG